MSLIDGIDIWRNQSAVRADLSSKLMNVLDYVPSAPGSPVTHARRVATEGSTA